MLRFRNRHQRITIPSAWNCTRESVRTDGPLISVCQPLPLDSLGTMTGSDEAGHSHTSRATYSKLQVARASFKKGEGELSGSLGGPLLEMEALIRTAKAFCIATPNRLRGTCMSATLIPFPPPSPSESRGCKLESIASQRVDTTTDSGKDESPSIHPVLGQNVKMEGQHKEKKSLRLRVPPHLVTPPKSTPGPLQHYTINWRHLRY